MVATVPASTCPDVICTASAVVAMIFVRARAATSAANEVPDARAAPAPPATITTGRGCAACCGSAASIWANPAGVKVVPPAIST